MPSMILTPNPSAGTVTIDVTPDGLTLRTVQRIDANSNLSVSVRTPAGTLPTSAPVTLTDHEVALTGSEVLYIANFDDPADMIMQATTPPAPVTEAAAAGWLTLPLIPDQVQPLVRVTNYDEARGSMNVYHDVIDRSDPAVTLSRLRTRAGTLELWCQDYPTVRGVVELLNRAEVLLLRQTRQPGLDLYFGVDDAVGAAPHVAQRNPTQWSVRVGYREVARPQGSMHDFVEPWTFGVLAGAYDSFDQVRAAFATFDDLAAGNPS